MRATRLWSSRETTAGRLNKKGGVEPKKNKKGLESVWCVGVAKKAASEPLWGAPKERSGIEDVKKNRKKGKRGNLTSGRANSARG